MNHQSKSSGNSYVEFSFERSLRDYIRRPHKKIKYNHCNGSEHSSVCECAKEKLNGEGGFLSKHKKMNLRKIR